MRWFYVVCLVGCVVAAGAGPAAAQSPACPDGALGVVLSPAAIESLAALRRSAFAHAFLVDLVATEGCRDHPAAVRARDAAGPAPSAEAWEALASGPLTADALVAAFRDERRRVDRARATAASLGDLSELVFQATLGLPTSPVPAARELATPERGVQVAAVVARLRMARVEGGLARSAEALDRAAGTASAWAACDAAREQATQARRAADALAQEVDADRSCPPAEGDPPGAACAPEVVGRLEARAERLRVLQGQATRRETERDEACDGIGAEPAFDRPPHQTAEAVQTEWGRLRASERRELEVAAVSGPAAGSVRASLAQPDLEVTSAAALPSLAAGNAALPVSAAFPTELAVAVADFAIERMRDELVLAYLGRVPERLRGPQWLRDLFPATFGLTRDLSSAELYQLSLPAWRSALVADLQRLPVNALRSDALLDSVRAAPAGRVAVGRVRAGLGVAEALRDGERPLDLLVDLPRRFEADVLAADPHRALFVGGARLASHVAYDLRLQDVDVRADSLPRYVLSERTLRQASPGHRRVYAALLVAALGPGVGEVDREALLDAASVTVGQTTDLLAGVAALAAPGASAVGRARQAADLVGLALGVPLALSTTLDAARRAELDRVRARWVGLARILASLDAGDATGALTQSMAFFADVAGVAFPTETGVLPLVTLGAALADADDSGAMVRAFRSTALPPGGYRARRAGRGARVALNLYPGVVGGAEWLTDVEGGGRAALVGGLTLPVGVNVHLSRGVSVFASALDLGAFLSYRLGGLRLADGTEVDDTPDVTFREMLSPGLALIVGVADWPVALSASVQLMPSLRNLTRDGAARNDATTVRAGLSLSYDLPLLDLSPARGLR